MNSKVGPKLFFPWFEKGKSAKSSVQVLNERHERRELVFNALVDTAADHVVGLKAIESLGGFPNAMHILKNRIPKGKISRSGLLGEILATEYVDQETEFSIPVRRLRYRDTRDLAMRGDDVLGFQVSNSKVKVIKVEAKSRVNLATATLEEARDGLAKHNGRPNPETMAFLECFLRLHDRDLEAEPITALQKNAISPENICHLIFTLSGNDPSKFLEENSSCVHAGIELRLCGCKVAQHVDFVKNVFDACLTRGSANGNN